MTQKEMYELYVHMHGSAAASETVMRQTYVQEWKKVLKIRGRSQHAMCQDCFLLAVARLAVACCSNGVLGCRLIPRLSPLTDEEGCWKVWAQHG